MKKIPIEILSKYYIRLYTINSNFYKNLNKDLGTNKIDKYLTFIKVLYEGLKLKSFPLALDKVLYRGSKISISELEKIKSYLINKIQGLPSSIVFSRSFLSFSKERKLAEKFLHNSSNNDMNLPKVLYILENDNNLGYNLSTHGDIEKISFYPDEKEVLFFPFSAFVIKSLEQIEKNNEIIYEIKLVYLGKYLKDIEDDNDLISNEFPLPESEFATQLMVNGLIQKEILMNLNTHVLYCNFKKYEDKMNYEEQLALEEINKIKEYYEIEKNYEEQLSLDELDNYDSDEIKENIER